MGPLPASPGQWHLEHLNQHLFLASRISRVLYQGKTRYQQVEIVETVPFGRCLILDGRTQSCEADEFIYHEALVQPALSALEGPRSVLIAGGGEGATLREALSHRTVERVVMVDLDQEVVGLCQEHLPNHHQGAFQDPRLELVYEDAGQYLGTTQERFDLIILDLPDPLEGGPAYLLYTQEFYSLTRQRLKPRGLLALQAGACGPLNFREVFTAVHRTLATVFPRAAPYRVDIPSFGTSWGFVIAGGEPDPTALGPEEIDARLAARLSRPLRFYDGVTHGALFCLPRYVREGLSQETRVITRGHPLYTP